MPSQLVRLYQGEKKKKEEEEVKKKEEEDEQEEKKKVAWSFTPSQPVRLYRG